MRPFRGVKVRNLNRKKVVLTGIIIFASITTMFGSKLILFMVDYKDENVSLANIKLSITNVEAEENDAFFISVQLHNNYSRDITIKLIMFNIFENKTGDVLMTGMIDYSAREHNGFILSGHAEHTEEFTEKALAQIEHGTPIDVRVVVSVRIRTKYYRESRIKSETNTTITFY